MSSAPFTISDELRQLILRQRDERPEHDHAPQHLPQAAAATGTPIRCKNRQQEWHGAAYRAAAEIRKRHQGEADEINAALAAELAEGPDWARCHRGSEFLDPPKNNLDRNYVARIWFVAQMIERKSWDCRKKWKHGGTLGAVAMDLLRVLLFVVKKVGGKLYPSYQTLAVLTRKSRQAIITAMQVLNRMGFVTVHRRIKRVMTPIGPKMVQDSNAYEFHLPSRGLGKLAMSVFCPPSESNKSDARKLYIQQEVSTEANVSRRESGDPLKGQSSKEVDRWWLHDPIPMGNGSWR
jgi:hypothetical protein